MRNGFRSADDLRSYALLCLRLDRGWDMFYESFDRMRSAFAGENAFMQMFRVASKAWDEAVLVARAAGPEASAGSRAGCADENGAVAEQSGT